MQKYHDEPKQYKGYLKSALTSRNCSTPATNSSRIWRSRRRRCQPVGGPTRLAPPPRAPHHPSASYDAAPRKGARPPGHRRVAGAAVAGHRPPVRRGSRTGHRHEPARDRGTRGDGRANAPEYEHALGPVIIAKSTSSWPDQPASHGRRVRCAGRPSGLATITDGVAGWRTGVSSTRWRPSPGGTGRRQRRRC